MRIVNKTLIQFAVYSSFISISAYGGDIDCQKKIEELKVDCNNIFNVAQKDTNLSQLTRQRATSTSKLLDPKYKDTAYSRVLKYIGNQQIPDSLKPLSEAFDDISDKIKKNDFPDIIDIIFLLEGDGKTHSIVLTEFLSVIEDRLAASADKRIPGINLKIASVVDAFVGSGSGSIPAAIAALGNMYLRESIPIIMTMNTKLLVPKSLGVLCGCFGNCRKTSGAMISAYFDKEYVAADGEDNDLDWNELTYDSFNFQKKGGKGLIDIFGSASTSDLQSSLEVISLENRDNVMGLVLGALNAKDSDAKSRIKKFALAETLNTASDIFTISSNIKNDDNFTKKAESAVDSIEKVKVVLKKSDEKKSGTLSEFRDTLTSRKDIQRDLIIVSVSADTSDKKIIIPNFGFTVKHTQNDKKIISMNYRFSIPNYLYNPKSMEVLEYEKLLNKSVLSVFSKNNQNDPSKKDTKIALASEMLINFLDTCNKRVIDEVDKLSIIPDVNEDSREDDMEFFSKI